MWLTGFIAVVFIVMGGIFADFNTQSIQANADAETQVIAGNMMVYRNAVLAYAEANPGVTGQVSDSNLALPAWFAHVNGVANYVNAGKGYVFYPNSQNGLAYTILKMSNNSINVGIDQNGYVVSPLPLSGPSTIPVPAAIPNGAVVIANG